MIKKIKNRDFLFSLIIFLCLVLTQFSVRFNLGHNYVNIYYAEFLNLLLIGFCSIYIIMHKEKINFKAYFSIFLLLFIIWFGYLTIYRFYVFHTITGGLIVFRNLVFPIFLYLSLKYFNISKKNILNSILLFITFINIYQIYNLFFVKNSFRTIGGLQNINIYLCFVISSITLIFYYYKKIEDYYSNLKFNFSIFSGSRLALLMILIVPILSYFILYKFNLKSLKYFMLFLLSILFILTLIIKINLYDAKYNFTRAVPKNIDEFIYKIFPDKVKKSKKIIDDSIPQVIIETNVVESNSMRTQLWKKSIEYIKKDPIHGKLNIDIDIDFKFQGTEKNSKIIQSPHNFILELWLSFGLPGMIIYLGILVIMFLEITHKNVILAKKILFTIFTFSLFSFSFF